MKTTPRHFLTVRLATLGFLPVFFAASAPAASLLVAEFGGDKVVEYDRSTGVAVGTFASGAGMDGPAAMVYGGDGNLYVLNEFSHNVLRFNGATGAFIDEFISAPVLGAAGVTDPDDIEVGPDGNFYITAHFSNPSAAIWKFSSTTGGFLGAFATFDATSHTHGLTFGPGGKVFLGDLGAGVIRQFNATTGANLGTFSGDVSLSLAADLAFALDGTLYVTCDGGNGVQRFSAAGAVLPPLIAPGGGESWWGILIDGGSLYVGNKATGVIKEYTDTGAVVADRVTGSAGPFDILAKTVPEPSGLSLLVVAALGLGARRRRYR